MQGNLVHEVKEVRRVLVEHGEPGVRRENQGPRAQQGTTAPQVHPVRGDLKDLRDPWVSPDRRAPLDRPERTDCLDIPASVERRVSKGKPAPLVQEVLSDLRDPLERPVQSVSEAIPDPLDHQESRVFQAPVAKREQRETLDLLGPPVKTVPLVSEASLGSGVYLAPRAQQVLKEGRGPKVHLAPSVLQVKEVLLVQLVQLAFLVDPVLKVPQVLPERREHLVRKGPKVQLVAMVSRVP